MKDGRAVTSGMPCRKYSSQLLDSSSSLGQMSSISQQQEPAKKGGLWGLKKKSSSKGPMPSITEQSGATSKSIEGTFWDTFLHDESMVMPKCMLGMYLCKDL